MSSQPLAFPTIDSFIAKLEGFGTPNATTINNANNPGSIIPGTFATAHGATGVMYTAGGQPVAVFPDALTGTAAEDALVQQYANNGASITDLVNAWAPPTAPGNSPGATQNYINNLASMLGVSPTSPVTSAEQAYDQSHGITPGSTSSASSPITTAATSGITNAVLNALGLGAFAGTSGSSSAFSFARIGAFVLGFILIAGGLYLFKPVQEAVNTTVKKGAEIGAASA